MNKILDLGCGNRKEHWIKDSDGLDMCDFGQKYIWNLERLDFWPMEDGVYNEVVANHILEHIASADAFIHILNEVHRVLKPGGIFRGAAPRWDSPNFTRDPTHCRMISEYTFDGFLKDSPIHFNDYGITCSYYELHKTYINPNRDVIWVLGAVK